MAKTLPPKGGFFSATAEQTTFQLFKLFFEICLTYSQKHDIMLMSKGDTTTPSPQRKETTMTFIDTITIEELYDYDTRAFMELLHEVEEEKEVA